MAARANKILMLVLIFCSFIIDDIDGQNIKYIVQSDQVKQIKIYDAVENVRYILPTFKKTGGGFLLEITDPSQAYIITEANESLKLKLYSIAQNQQTEWFEIGKDELISIERCTNKYKEKLEWTMSGMSERITQFFNLGKNGLVLEGDNAVMHSSSKWISFSVPGLPEFISPNSLFFKWETIHPVGEIKIVDVKSNKTLLVEKNPQFQILTNDKPTKKRKFKKGRFYKFTFTPTENNMEYGPKSIVAYFYSKKEIEQINSFISK